MEQFDDWSYNKYQIHITDFDKYKKYGKFFVVNWYGLFYYLVFDKIKVYALYDDIEDILKTYFKNEIRKEKLKQLDMLHNI